MGFPALCNKGQETGGGGGTKKKEKIACTSQRNDVVEFRGKGEEEEEASPRPHATEFPRRGRSAGQISDASL